MTTEPEDNKKEENKEEDPKDKKIAELETRIKKLEIINNTLAGFMLNIATDMLLMSRNAGKEMST
ncbi:hypothetical protein [Serratia sp. (in: enterobacteria)]|uniref:hypothetical protein n=1 Tax=Serratia sp. (in: enterobacteria) TaxID=616 RepID=UPI003989623E